MTSPFYQQFQPPPPQPPAAQRPLEVGQTQAPDIRDRVLSLLTEIRNALEHNDVQEALYLIDEAKSRF